jgi:hypothetical protein
MTLTSKRVNREGCRDIPHCAVSDNSSKNHCSILAAQRIGMHMAEVGRGPGDSLTHCTADVPAHVCKSFCSNLRLVLCDHFLHRCALLLVVFSAFSSTCRLPLSPFPSSSLVFPSLSSSSTSSSPRLPSSYFPSPSAHRLTLLPCPSFRCRPMLTRRHQSLHRHPQVTVAPVGPL